MAFQIAQVLECLLEEVEAINEGKVDGLAAENLAQVMFREELRAGGSKDPAACGPAAVLLWVGIDADGECVGLDRGQGASSVYTDLDVSRGAQGFMDPPQHLAEAGAGEGAGRRQIVSGHLREIIRLGAVRVARIGGGIGRGFPRAVEDQSQIEALLLRTEVL
jgi:hypothetical protein